MSGRVIFVLGLLLFSSLSYVRFQPIQLRASNGYAVHNLDTHLNYTSIQAAINANETLDGHTILVEAGTYYEHIVVNKSVSLFGEEGNTTVIDVLSIGTAVQITANEVLVRNFLMRNAGRTLEDCGIRLSAVEDCDISCNTLVDCGQNGITLSCSLNNYVAENVIVDSGSAIVIVNSAFDNVERNLVKNSKVHGIVVQNSSRCKINENFIIDSLDDGIAVLASGENLIQRNTVVEGEEYGIRLDDPSNSNTFAENVVADNEKGGFWMWYSSNNSLYHNFCNNTKNAIVLSAPGYDSTNTWDGGALSGGNFWSDYNGSDSDHNGIGDDTYIIDANNVDNYPLMGRFRSFSTSLGYSVDVVSNSTIDYFEYFEGNSTIKMLVSNTTANHAYGFCRICIPNALMDTERVQILVDEGWTAVLFVNYAVYHDATRGCIYFAYEHPTHKIDIIPEFSSFPIPLLSIVATLTTLMYRKRIKSRELEKYPPHA